MHARAGTGDGVMNHTISGRDFQNLWFNGTLVGETGINAALCGTWGCPVLLVTGDDASCREGKDLLGDGLTTVSVKRGLQLGSARRISRRRAHASSSRRVRGGRCPTSRRWRRTTPDDHVRSRSEYKNTNAAHALRFRAGVELIDARTIVSRADTWWEAWKQFYF